MIRRMTNKDRDEYLNMTKEFYASSAVDTPISGEFPHAIKTFDLIINKNPLVDGFIISNENNEIAGYALLSFMYSNEFGGIILLFEELYIRPLYQGFGYGSKMMKFIESEYKDKIVGIKLEVTKLNEHAIKIYEKKGFSKVNYLAMLKLFTGE